LFLNRNAFVADENGADWQRHAFIQEDAHLSRAG